MTQELLLKTAREILFKSSCNTELGCACCSPDTEGMFEYIDGAITELVDESIADYIEKHDMHG